MSGNDTIEELVWEWHPIAIGFHKLGIFELILLCLLLEVTLHFWIWIETKDLCIWNSGFIVSEIGSCVVFVELLDT